MGSYTMDEMLIKIFQYRQSIEARRQGLSETPGCFISNAAWPSGVCRKEKVNDPVSAPGLRVLHELGPCYTLVSRESSVRGYRPENPSKIIISFALAGTAENSIDSKKVLSLPHDADTASGSPGDGDGSAGEDRLACGGCRVGKLFELELSVR